jgi:hypothetical protein
LDTEYRSSKHGRFACRRESARPCASLWTGYFVSMARACHPLRALSPDSLIEYLGRDGNSPGIVQWKYFDSRFNGGRERGYSWVRDGRIGGFVGLIPFQVVVGSRVAEAGWTCDWCVQDQTGCGTGRDNGRTVPELWPSSFLDTNFAYRFSEPPDFGAGRF